MNSLEDPTAHISIEEDEPDNEEHNDPTNHEGQQHDKDHALECEQTKTQIRANKNDDTNTKHIACLTFVHWHKLKFVHM